MTVYARSDVTAVSISPAHGGCGTTHSRPVVGGAPARLWSLVCNNGCEDVLRYDVLWSAVPTAVPETPDETNIREDAEKRGQIEQMQSTATALQDLAKLGDLPSAIAQLAQMMAGQHALPSSTSMSIMCKHGHNNTATARFCGECGVSMSEPVDTNRGVAITAATATPSDDLDKRSLAELRVIGRKLGVEDGRTKKEQLTRIREAMSSRSTTSGVTTAK